MALKYGYVRICDNRKCKVFDFQPCPAQWARTAGVRPYRGQR
jgi:hypothetical protein